MTRVMMMNDEELVVGKETGIGGRWRDRVTGSCQGIQRLFWIFKKGATRLMAFASIEM